MYWIKERNEKMYIYIYIYFFCASWRSYCCSGPFREDPDILMGYEIQTSSWSYAISRASELGINLRQELSRIPKEKVMDGASDIYGSRHTSEIHVVGEYANYRVHSFSLYYRISLFDDIIVYWLLFCNGFALTKSYKGRIVLNVWRLLRSELALTSYSFENTVFHVLHQRVPLFSPAQLAAWWCDGPLARSGIFVHTVSRCGALERAVFIGVFMGHCNASSMYINIHCIPAHKSRFTYIYSHVRISLFFFCCWMIDGECFDILERASPAQFTCSMSSTSFFKQANLLAFLAFFSMRSSIEVRYEGLVEIVK